MSTWSRRSAGSKVIVSQMSNQKKRKRRGTEDFEINSHLGAHSGKYGKPESDNLTLVLNFWKFT